MNKVEIDNLAEDEIVLTPQQQQIVDSDMDEQLVRGIAGSGKTLVLLKKAKKKAKQNPDEKTMIFTYAKSLTNASKITMQRHGLGNLNVSTFHSWAMRIYYKVFSNRADVVQGYKQKNLVKEAIRSTRGNRSHRFIADEKYVDFLQSEISFIKGMEVRTLKEYSEVSRRGRGASTRVTLADREIIFDIFTNYESKKGQKMDFDDFAYKLSKVKNRIPEEAKLDHVFVDEAQDLQLIQIRLLKHCGMKTITIAADKGQKIYDTAFSWRDAGLNIQGGRTKILKESHRSTKQIIELAVSLQENDAITQDEEYVRPNLPDREGMKPVLRKFETRQAHDEAILDIITTVLKNTPEATIGVLYRNSFGRDAALSRLGGALRRNGVDFMDIRGKDEVNPFTPGVKFSTFHSAKGLEFHFVLIVDLNDPAILPSEDEADDYWNNERRLLYVAITRAKNALYMFTHGNENRLLREMDSSLYDIK